MHRALLALLPLSLLLGACHTETIKSTNYIDPKSGFSFDYPADWLIEGAGDIEAGYDAVAWIYTPESAAALLDCRKKHAEADWQMLCGSLQADSAIGIYNDVAVDYAVLDEVARSNFPEYRAWPESELGVFEYAGRTDPPSRTYHLNRPGMAGGAKVTVFSPDKRKLDAAELVTRTFNFEKAAR